MEENKQKFLRSLFTPLRRHEYRKVNQFIIEKHPDNSIYKDRYDGILCNIYTTETWENFLKYISPNELQKYIKLEDIDTNNGIW